MAKQKVRKKADIISASVTMDTEPPDFTCIDDPEPKESVPGRDWLFDLYLARVAKAETVNTMRRDPKAIFRDAFFEAKVALDVFEEMTRRCL